jgi:hypothetical protein
MNERWTYTVISDEPGGTPIEMRVVFQDRDSNQQATIQIRVNGQQVEVDDQPRDYEAPEWKAKHLLEAGGTEDVDGYLAELKAHLRAAISG